jgi:hypothetical protein
MTRPYPTAEPLAQSKKAQFQGCLEDRALASEDGDPTRGTWVDALDEVARHPA